jgi:hypothetical protein
MICVCITSTTYLMYISAYLGRMFICFSLFSNEKILCVYLGSFIYNTIVKGTESWGLGVPYISLHTWECNPNGFGFGLKFLELILIFSPRHGSELSSKSFLNMVFHVLCDVFYIDIPTALYHITIINAIK